METTDGAEWKLLTWVEQGKRRLAADVGDSKIMSAYLKSGRPRELLHQALSNIQTLSDYETELLTLGKVEVANSRRFFEIAKALLGEARFDGLLGEAKADELEGRKARKSPTARLIHRIMEAVGAPVAQPKAGSSIRIQG